MKFKRFLTGFTALSMAIGGLAMSQTTFSANINGMSIQANAENAKTSEDQNYRYYVCDDGTVEIVRCDVSGEDVIIPSKIDGRIVRRITCYGGDVKDGHGLGVSVGAFEDSNIKSVTIPASVNYIDIFAFGRYDCLGEKVSENGVEISGTDQEDNLLIGFLSIRS